MTALPRADELRVATASAPAHFVIHEFLLASTLRRLITFLAQRQGLFRPATGCDGVRVLDELVALREFLASALLEAVPEVAARCGVASLDAAGVEMRVWSRGGGFVPPAHAAVAADRALGFVLFLHREPRQFEGGSLHLCTSTGESIIEPSQNSLVFFRGSSAARIGAIRTTSNALIDSSLTLEGWVRASRAVTAVTAMAEQ